MRTQADHLHSNRNTFSSKTLRRWGTAATIGLAIGFVGSLAAHAALTDLDTLTTTTVISSSEATAINTSGQVAVTASSSTSSFLVPQAYLWDARRSPALTPLGAAGLGSDAFGINDAGQVVGDSIGTSGLSHATLWNISGSTITSVDLNATISLDSSTPTSTAYSINQSGQAVGFTFLADGMTEHAMLWNSASSTFVDLGTLSTPSMLGTLGVPGDGNGSAAFGINQSGQVVGYSTRQNVDALGNPIPALDANGNPILDANGNPIFYPTEVSHAVVWDPTPGPGGSINYVIHDLGTLSSSTLGTGPGSLASAINDAGQVAGYSYTDATGTMSHAVVWIPTSNPAVYTPVDLGTLGGSYSGPGGFGGGINASGQVAGYASIAGDAVYHAVVWSPTSDPTVYSYEELPLLAGGNNNYAWGLNDAGKVVGQSETVDSNLNATSHAFLYDPSGGGPQIANAGPDQNVAAGGNCSALVSLDGSKSKVPPSPPGSHTSYTWTEAGSPIAHGVKPPAVPLGIGVHIITLTITQTVGPTTSPLGSDSVTIMVADHTPPTFTSHLANVTVPATSAAGAVVNLPVPTATDACSPPAPVTSSGIPDGNLFPVGVTAVTYVASDAAGNTTSVSIKVTVTSLPASGSLGRFVALSADSTWLQSGATVNSGDVGAALRRQRAHGHGADFDDGDNDDVTMRVDQGATMAQAGSRVVGDTVVLMGQSSVYDVIDNFLLRKRGSMILGTTMSPMAVPYVAMPAFPTVAPGNKNVTVAKNQTLTLVAGNYGTVHVSTGAKLILAGLYQMASLDVDQSATIVFHAATQIRIKTQLDTDAKSKLILDPAVTGLKASQMVIYVQGADKDCRHLRADDNGDDPGSVTVDIGTQNVVQANIYAANGTVWLNSKTQATGAFIGQHVRIGQGVTLTLSSAFGG